MLLFSLKELGQKSYYFPTDVWISKAGKINENCVITFLSLFPLKIKMSQVHNNALTFISILLYVCLSVQLFIKCAEFL